MSSVFLKKFKVVGAAGLEPARHYWHLILSQARIPIPTRSLMSSLSLSKSGLSGVRTQGLRIKSPMLYQLS